MKYNLPEITRFFNFFSGGDTKKIFTFCVLDIESIKPLTGLGTVFHSTEELPQFLNGINSTNWTLHVCLNQTSDKGRKLRDIQNPQVVCVDIDEWTSDMDMRELISVYVPELVVSSSIHDEGGEGGDLKAKYHLYWKLSPTTTLEQWQVLQSAFAWKLKGDTHLNELNKTIRVPGVERTQKDESLYTPEIVYENLPQGRNGKSFDQFLIDFPWIMEALKEYKAHAKSLNRVEKKIFNSLDFVPRSNGGSVGSEVTFDIEEIKTLVTSEGRNTTLYSVLKNAIKGGKITDSNQVVYVGHALQNIFLNITGAKLEQDEFEKTLRSVMDRSTFLPSSEHAEMEVVEAEIEEEGDEKKEKVYTNGHDKKHMGDMSETEIINSDTQNKLPKLEPIEFEYNYKTSALKENRFTDDSITERVVQRYGQDMCRVDGVLYAFNEIETLWKPQTLSYRNELGYFAGKVLKDTRNEKKFLEYGFTKDGWNDKAYARAQEKFSSVRIKEGITRDVFSHTGIKKKKISEFDAKLDLLFCSNGVLNLETRGLRPAKHSDYLLTQSDIIFNEDAECLQWIDFLNQVFPDAPDMVSFMQELFGYSISGSINEQKLFCHYGSGANGKSKVLSALAKLTGGYGTYIDPDIMTTTKGAINQKSFERLGYRIEGKRSAIVDDIDVNTVWNESFVKNLTSPFIRARGEHQVSREITNRCKMHLGLNVAPTPQAENLGILRRLCIIPYLRTFQANAADSDRIDALIHEESSGILNWAMVGYQRILANGNKIIYPEATELAINEYKSENFMIEGVVGSLYQKSESKDDFEFTSAITQDIENYLMQNGTPRKVSSDEISRCFKVLFGLHPEKKWDGDRGNMFRGFNVKLIRQRMKSGMII